jgi:hypothetical protein
MPYYYYITYTITFDVCINTEDLKINLMVENLAVKLNDWLKKEQFFNEQKNPFSVIFGVGSICLSIFAEKAWWSFPFRQ